jgi:hypothetical protein
LKSQFDWGFLESFPGVTVVNECGISDNVLCLSEAFVPKTGMAGRTGFYGFNSDKFMNRYHEGGHSLYFEGQDFMKEKWLPLFTENPTLSGFDQRSQPTLFSHIVERSAAFVGRFWGMFSGWK